MNLYGFADGDPINFSDPFGLIVTVQGAALEEAIAVLMNSATFKAIFGSLDAEPESRVNYFMIEASQAEVMEFGGVRSKVGHTIVSPFKSKSVGRSLINRATLTNAVIVHELVHAAGAYAAKGIDTDVRRGCETGTGHGRPACEDVINRILEEIREWREKQPEEEKLERGN
ncbi:MAG: hypothetical protein GTO22_21380 [Gemmatimonadales bacterium]|nr:hypothetical protein [Gemmatimonadales bacterium]